jgi:hypothetical protein
MLNKIITSIIIGMVCEMRGFNLENSSIKRLDMKAPIKKKIYKLKIRMSLYNFF